ncbi:MAG: 50S ribosomal protein L11 methyltransferase [Acidimicrobiia bacterium]
MEQIAWKGRLGPFDLEVGEHTFRPTTITTLLADALAPTPGDVVIDVGSGSGILAILAAKLGAARVIATDNSEDTQAVGTVNAAKLGVADKIEFFRGDLFEPLPEGVQADLIIGDVSGIPDDLAAESGWFPSKVGGGPRGSELPIRMLQEAKRWLRPGGRLLLPTGSLQDEAAILAVAKSAYGQLREMASRMIPLPSMLSESMTVRRLVDRGIVRLRARGSRFLWEAKVWELRPGIERPLGPVTG